MSNIPANLYFGPELPLNALPGAVFNDGVCLYRGGEYGWMYICHVSTIQKLKDSPLAPYAISVPEGELASLNEPMATYRDGAWLLLANQIDDIIVYGLVFDNGTRDDSRSRIPDDTLWVLVKLSGHSRRGDINDLTLMYRHEGEDYMLDQFACVPDRLVPSISDNWLRKKEPHMPYLDLDISARFVVNTDKPPSPGDNWIDSEFNEFVFDATRMWTPIGKIAFNYRGSLLSGIDVLRLQGPHVTGDAYLVDNFVYIYNSIVNRFVVIQCAPGSDDVPFNFYPPEALEPIPIQGIYRRDVDALPCEPNGCGWIVVEHDGKHSLYNQYGLLVEVELQERAEYPCGKRSPMVVMGTAAHRDACYQWDGLDPEEGDVWLEDKQLYTFYKGDWRILPAGIPYTQRHTALAIQVEEIKERIKLGKEMGRPLLSQQTKDQLFEDHRHQYETERARRQHKLEEQSTLSRFVHSFRTWIRRLCSSKPR